MKIEYGCLYVRGPLKKVPDAETLATIDGLSIKKLGAFAELPPLPSVVSIGMGKNAMTSLRGIEKLRTLESMRIDENKIDSLAPLAKLKRFQALWAQKCGLKSLRGLPSTMVTLCVNNNALTSIDGVEKMKDLEDLLLDHNKLTRIPDLSKLKKLDLLTLEGNKIPRLENLHGLKSLTNLGIQGDAVTSVAPKTAEWLLKRPRGFKLYVGGDHRTVTPRVWLRSQTIA